ncbi:hypothetical protein [Adhaeribacter aquaticus]|uniref:hypothetical protein n=1 Tax=Adhaeribacter aquaticus TaxID=299567 RepID=UPI000478A846|nr:hypothetical protein [Adhaeribacter aquaticus]
MKNIPKKKIQITTDSMFKNPYDSFRFSTIGSLILDPFICISNSSEEEDWFDREVKAFARKKKINNILKDI